MHSRISTAACGVGIGLGLLLSSPVCAAINSTGSVTFDPLGCRVGDIANGTLNINSGSVLSGVSGAVAFATNCTATATVTGTGSTWANSGALSVGTYGYGVLNVQAGGLVTSSSGYLGQYSSGTGAVTITGAGSTWSINNVLHVGYYGNATLTVSDGGLVSAGTLEAPWSRLLGNGTIQARGAILDTDLIFDNAHGPAQSFAFGTGGKLELNVDGTGGLGVGVKGTGTLRIADGRTITSTDGNIGSWDTSTGTALVTGPGSTWINSGNLYVGSAGHGTLTIEAGGQVRSTSAYLGRAGNGSGTVMVTGPGSTWNNSGDILFTQSGGHGKLIVADGGKVTATNLTSSFSAPVQLNVSGNDMIVLGNATTNGTIGNHVSLYFYADAFLPAGIYTPISPYPGKVISWPSTIGSAWGGTWSDTTHRFTVPAATALPSGGAANVTGSARLIFTDNASGQRLGAVFNSASPVSFSAAAMTDSEKDALAAVTGPASSVLAGWDFTTGLTGTSVMLSMDVGPGVENYTIWHGQNGTWSPFTPDWTTCSNEGFLTFPVTSFSSYAVTAVPEPASVTLLGLGLTSIVIMRKRR